jgi:hypothetical protein
VRNAIGPSRVRGAVLAVTLAACVGDNRSQGSGNAVDIHRHGRRFRRRVHGHDHQRGRRPPRMAPRQRAPLHITGATTGDSTALSLVGPARWLSGGGVVALDLDASPRLERCVTRSELRCRGSRSAKPPAPGSSPPTHRARRRATGQPRYEHRAVQLPLRLPVNVPRARSQQQRDQAGESACRDAAERSVHDTLDVASSSARLATFRA